MAAKNSPPCGAPPGAPVPIRDLPDAAAQTFDAPDGLWVVESFTAHGPYVLYQSAQKGAAAAGRPPEELVSATVGLQANRIDEFVPTPVEPLRATQRDPCEFGHHSSSLVQKFAGMRATFFGASTAPNTGSALLIPRPIATWLAYG
jgi:hypothetical protein